MPPAQVIAGGKEVQLQFDFWGDELERKLVRAIAQIRLSPGERFSVRSSDRRLVPLGAELYVLCCPVPSSLDLAIPVGAGSRHPRLLLGEEDVRALRSRSSPLRRRILGRLHDFKAVWDATLAPTPESKIPPGPEKLAPEDRLLVGAYLSLLEKTQKDVRRGVEALIEYVRLTQHSDFEPLAIDTQSGEVLFLLSVGFDWLYADLDDEQRALIRRRLWELADVCWGYLGYGRRDYAQAHYLGCALGLIAFSLLFPDEHPRAREWGGHCAGVLKLVLSLLPPDGFYAHGVNLWIYEFGFLLRWLELFRTAGGLDLWPDGGVLRCASGFRDAATSPDGLCGLAFGDPQYRVGGDSWCHYLIAARTGSGEARGLGDRLLELPVEGVDFRSAPARRRIYEHLWFPEDVHPVELREGLRSFPDGAQFFVRTSGTLFTFRSGPPMGAHRYAAGLTGGYGHSDPCNGSFLYYAGGSLAIAGPGPVYRRDTALHNVITINGQGQIGDSAVWAPGFIPPSALAPRADVNVAGKTVTATVDSAPCYLPHLGVRLMRRSMLIDAGRCIVGADVVELLSDASIEWNLHSWLDFALIEAKAMLAFRIGGAGGNRLYCRVPPDTQWESGLSEFVPAYPNNGTRDKFIRLICRGKAARFFWCITCGEDREPQILARDAQVSWQFGDGTEMTFDGITIHQVERV
jgi:hypothetical protein